MSNPTTGADLSDSAGRFPQVFAAESLTFDILLKSSAGGATIASYLNVVTLGSTSGSLVRDFTTSRFQARGSGGTTYIEAGDPVGDDIGGTMRLGGWNGTQADLATLDTTLLNVTGRIKENSKKLIGTVYTEATTFTAVASVDITLPNDPTGVRAWDVEVFDYSQSGNANLQARFSYDSGSTYKAGAADYGWMYDLATSPAAVASISGASATDTNIYLAGNLNSAANRLGMVKLRIVTVNSGNDATLMDTRAVGIINTGAYSTFTGFGFGGTTYGRATNLRLLVSANTMTGKYLVRPLRGYGEV